MFNKNFICIISFFTINLYNFILFILNRFFKKYLKIIIEGFTDELYPLAFDPISPTHLQTDFFHRYVTIAFTITDGFPDG